jgi:hypothetical protein
MGEILKLFYFIFLFVFYTAGLFPQYKGGVGRGDASALLYSSPLPVELSSFEGSRDNLSIKLLWRTTSETNNYGFSIERAAPTEPSQGVEQFNFKWETIGFVNGAGNSNSPKNYNFYDKNIIGKANICYRLKQIDNDGAYKYSDIISIHYVPEEFALFQNYPNPFNPVTTIRYQVPVTSKVIIKVYNILGVELAELVNDQKEPGIYDIDFIGETFASGVYIYKIFTGTFSNSRKMILLK